MKKALIIGAVCALSLGWIGFAQASVKSKPPTTTQLAKEIKTLTTQLQQLQAKVSIYPSEITAAQTEASTASATASTASQTATSANNNANDIVGEIGYLGFGNTVSSSIDSIDIAISDLQSDTSCLNEDVYGSRNSYC